MIHIMAILSLLASFTVAASEFDTKSQQFCEKIKDCVFDEMAGQDMSPAVAALAKPMIDSMCDELKQSVIAESAKVPGDIEPDLVACIDSMTVLSCSALMEGKAETSACQSLQEKAKQYQ